MVQPCPEREYFSWYKHTMHNGTSFLPSGPPMEVDLTYYQHLFVVSSSLLLCIPAALSPLFTLCLSLTHTQTYTPTTVPLSLSLSFSLAACEKLHLLFSVCVHMQARTRPRKPSDYAYTKWTDHTPACTHAHVANTHTPEPHLTQWVVGNSPDSASLNSAAIYNKVEKGVLFNWGLKE